MHNYINDNGSAPNTSWKDEIVMVPGLFPAFEDLTPEHGEAYNTALYKGKLQGIFPVDGKSTSGMNSAYGKRDINIEPPTIH